MSTSFRKPYQLFTRVQIVYDETSGLPETPVETASTFMATIQPAKLTDYDQAKASERGIDMSRTIRIYTDQRLNVLDRNSQMPGDIVVFLGTRYIVFAESMWQAMGTTIDHFRYLASRDEIPL